MADVGRLHDFVNGLPILNTEIVFPLGDRPVAGTFAETICLQEPASGDLAKAFTKMASFFARNEDDREWCGGQVNVFFAGHGVDRRDEMPLSRGGLVLKDQLLEPKELQQKLMNALPASCLEQWYDGSFGNCRVDLYLDCCYSGQFAGAFLGRLMSERRGLVPGKVWCSTPR